MKKGKNKTWKTSTSKKSAKEENVNNSRSAVRDSSGRSRRFKRYSRRVDDMTGSGGLWIISFTDIMALMLTFFVLLYSMSSTDDSDWQDITVTLQKNFSRSLAGAYNRGEQDTVDVSRLNLNRALDLRYLQALMGKFIEEEEALENIELKPVGRGLMISFPHDLIFKSGSAGISDEGYDSIYALALTLSKIRNRIEILGHTDPEVSSSSYAEYSSNWDLSLARASNVAAAFRKVGYDRPIMVRGLASAMYDSISDNEPEEVRLGMSRRVDIMIMDDDGSYRTFNGLSLE